MLSDFLFKTIQKFSFIKKTKLYSFIREIIFPLIIKNISIFFRDKVNENLVVMGAFSGGAFIDNTKYLFEFLNKNSDYELIWVAKTNKLLKELKKKGYNVVPQYNLQTIKLLRRAKYIFMTHGSVDVLHVKFSPKTIKVLVWHGTPLKNIDVNFKRDYRYNGWGDKFRLNLKYNDYTDYLLTATKDKKEHLLYCSALQISPRKLLDFGYPKNDILFNKDIEFIKKLRKKYEISESINKIILYAPTWREKTSWEFPLSNEILIEMNAFLEKVNAVYLIKAHLIEQRLNFKEYKNIRLVDKTADIQELALISDLLVTDYSSIFFDYLLTMKPIIFFAHDLKKYEEEKGFYYNYEDIVPGPIVSNAVELLKLLKESDRINEEYLEIRKNSRDRFNKYNDGKSIERLLKFLNISYS